MENRPRHRKDRDDAYFVRDADTMHKFMPFLLPRRTDNEAVLGVDIDLEPIRAYLEKKNADSPEFRYTFFHVICAALAKTAALRPKMNRFYAGHRLYERKDISLSFVVKKKFADDGTECLAIVKLDRDSDVSPLEQIYGQVKKIVYSVRKEQKDDGATDDMGTLLNFPRPILRFIMHILRRLEYHGKYPRALREEDPYYSTVFLSNLGSIRLSADYHHLTEWGTNSFFVVIGQARPTPTVTEDGTVVTKEMLKLGMTIDERIADGYYFAGAIRILKALLEHPELLDEPTMNEPETEKGRTDK